MGAIINDKEYRSPFMYNDDGVWQENEDGTWSEAVPLPYYQFMSVKCQCGKIFRKESKYRSHYVEAHTDGKKYNRTPTGLHEISAPNTNSKKDKV